MIKELISILDGSESVRIIAKKLNGQINFNLSKEEASKLKSELARAVIEEDAKSNDIGPKNSRLRHHVVGECLDGIQCLSCGKGFVEAHGYPVFCHSCFDITTVSERIYTNFIVRRAIHPEREE